MTMLLVLLAGFGAGGFALLRESGEGAGRLRPASWWRLVLAGVIALGLVFLGADVWWLAGVGAGVVVRVLGHSGRLDKWGHLPGVRFFTSRSSAAAVASHERSGQLPKQDPAGHVAPGSTGGRPAAQPAPTIMRLLERPAGDGDGDGGAPARRALVRWAWRLFRREWRQQLVMLALITAAVAATILGAAVATSTPPPANAGFGTANHLVNLPGNDPHLAADIAAIKAHFGAVDVIENESIATGLVQGAQLRTQDPNGRYGRPMLALVSGHYPSGAGEVAVTSQLASTFSLHIGGIWHEAGRSLRVAGLVENPQSLLDNFALVAPGQLSSPSQVTVLFDATAPGSAAFTFPQGAVPVTPQASTGISPAVIVLAFSVVGLGFVGLVSAAGFTVLAQRRMRALGMLSSLGATDRNARLVMVANGAVAGVAGALAGAVIGLAAWIAYAPHLAASAHHRVTWIGLPWWLAATAMVLAVVTATLAARRPARAIAQIPVVAALSGRPAPPKPVHRSWVPGIVLLGTGTFLIATSGGWSGSGTGDSLRQIGGLLATVAGLLLLGPLAISLLAVRSGRAPVAVRLALRELARYRARSGAALAATSLAVLIAMLISLLATGRYADVVDYFGPNLPSNQLIVYPPGYGPDGPGYGPAAPGAQRSPAQQRSRAGAIAASLGSDDVLALNWASAGLVHATLLKTTFGGLDLFVATPALLRHYGINPSAIAPATLLITSRPGLEGTAGLGLQYGNFQAASPTVRTVPNPKIQTFSSLPAGISDPNLLVTDHAVRTLRLQVSPGGWLIQTPRPLSPLQISTARQTAAAAGMTIETENQNPSLAEVRNDATAAGILLALGVLAMTVGLIRGETAGDLRTLTATGASSRTRRTITSTTAGALGLLGALLGTAVAYLATAAFFWNQPAVLMSNVPVLDLLLVLAGLPAAAAAGGWLFAVRQPSAIARQPLE